MDDQTRERFDALLFGEELGQAQQMTEAERAELERTWGTSPADAAQQAKLAAWMPEG